MPSFMVKENTLIIRLLKTLKKFQFDITNQGKDSRNLILQPALRPAVRPNTVPQVIVHYLQRDVVIGCGPTHPDVQVSLYQYFNNNQKTVSFYCKSHCQRNF